MSVGMSVRATMACRGMLGVLEFGAEEWQPNPLSPTSKQAQVREMVSEMERAVATAPEGVARPLPRAQRVDTEEVMRIARKYNLGLLEVQDMLAEFVKAPVDPLFDRREFEKLLERIFGGALLPEVTENAFQACDPWAAPDGALDRFFGWYQANMFTVLPRDDAGYRLAKKNRVSPVVIDKVRAAFDRFDTDRSGAVDEREFQCMLATLLRAKTQDLAKDRMKRFWMELDDGSGNVGFERFCCWYLKYFDPSDGGEKETLIGSFYDSFNSPAARALRTAGG